MILPNLLLPCQYGGLGLLMPRDFLYEPFTGQFVFVPESPQKTPEHRQKGNRAGRPNNGFDLTRRQEPTNRTKRGLHSRQKSRDADSAPELPPRRSPFDFSAVLERQLDISPRGDNVFMLYDANHSMRAQLLPTTGGGRVTPAWIPLSQTQIAHAPLPPFRSYTV